MTLLTTSSIRWTEWYTRYILNKYQVIVYFPKEMESVFFFLVSNIKRSILILKSMHIAFQIINSITWLSGQKIVGEKCFWPILLIKRNNFIFRKFFFWENLSLKSQPLLRPVVLVWACFCANHFLCICSVLLCSCCCKKKWNRNIMSWHRAPFLKRDKAEKGRQYKLYMRFWSPKQKWQID